MSPRRDSRRRAAAVLAALLAACSSAAPAAMQDVDPGFDHSAGLAVVALLDDEFARLDGERMPLDAVVLRLRWRARALTAEELSRFVVRIEVAADAAPGAAPAIVAARSRVLLELNVMEVGLAELR